ncbi:MAG: hypothetical protein OXF74_01560 [Rhodobacteraceae bacterium]|nr:hypothetical protein [Paracoccaceae bacterium]
MNFRPDESYMSRIETPFDNPMPISVRHAEKIRSQAIEDAQRIIANANETLHSDFRKEWNIVDSDDMIGTLISLILGRGYFRRCLGVGGKFLRHNDLVRRTG